MICQRQADLAAHIRPAEHIAVADLIGLQAGAEFTALAGDDALHRVSLGCPL